jgi:hypothetical protein
MSKLQSAPPAAAPKASQEFFHLPAFPTEGQVIVTVVGYNYIPEYQSPFDEDKDPYPAIEFFYGAETDGGIGFVKGYALRYSLHEKATYAKLYKLATGKTPAAGSKPDDMIGHGLSATVTNEAKTSKKGTAYTRSSIKDFGSVHPKLRGDITPVAKLRPLLDEQLAKSGDDKDEAGPF